MNWEIAMRVPVIVGLLLFTGCNFMSNSIPGSGTIKREVRQVGGFTKLAFAGLGTLTVTAGTEESTCAIQCDDNLLPYITTEVVDGQLQIHTSKGHNIAPTERLQIEISVPNLASLELAGATITNVSGLKETSFDAELAGSNDLTLEGEVDTAHFEAAGSCKILAAELNTKTTSIELAGSGSADVHATENLSVEIAGAGTVRYRGEPKIKQSIAGSGKIDKLP